MATPYPSTKTIIIYASPLYFYRIPACGKRIAPGRGLCFPKVKAPAITSRKMENSHLDKQENQLRESKNA